MAERSTFNLDKNIACALTYSFFWVSGLVFLLVEKNDKDVRFHAMQSILVFGLLTVINIVIGRIPLIGWSLVPLLNLGGFILWLVLLIKTYQGEKIRLPWASDIAEREAGKTS